MAFGFAAVAFSNKSSQSRTSPVRKRCRRTAPTVAAELKTTGQPDVKDRLSQLAKWIPLCTAIAARALTPRSAAAVEASREVQQAAHSGHERVVELVADSRRSELQEKLQAVPVFSITDGDGRPFLAEVDDVGNNEQASVLFFSYEDAERVLRNMKRKGRRHTEHAEISVLAMDEAYQKATSKPVPSGIMNNHGQEIHVVFRFYADQHEMREAERLLRNEGMSFEMLPQVPLFLAQGLTIRSGHDFIVPLYFSKHDLELTWEHVREKTPDMPEQASVHVVDLVKVLDGMENKAVSVDERLQSPELIFAS